MKIVYIDGKEIDLGKNVHFTIHLQTTRFYLRELITIKNEWKWWGIKTYNQEYKYTNLRIVFNSQIKEIIEQE